MKVLLLCLIGIILLSGCCGVLSNKTANVSSDLSKSDSNILPIVIEKNQSDISSNNLAVDNPKIQETVLLRIVNLTEINSEKVLIGEKSQNIYNLSSEDDVCIMAANSVSEGKKLLLLNYQFTNPTKKRLCVDDKYFLTMIDTDANEFGAKSPGSIIGPNCDTFPYFSSSILATSNSECFDAGESSDIYKLVFVPNEGSIPERFEYYVDYEKISQRIE